LYLSFLSKFIHAFNGFFLFANHNVFFMQSIYLILTFVFTFLCFRNLDSSFIYYITCITRVYFSLFFNLKNLNNLFVLGSNEHFTTFLLFQTRVFLKWLSCSLDFFRIFLMAVVSAPIRQTLLLYPGLGLASERIGLFMHPKGGGVVTDIMCK